MRRHISKLFMACLMAMTLMVVSAASAFAAGTGMDWSGDSKITVQGTGVAPTYAVNAVQARMLARRAAVVDAYRQLAEMVKGVNVDSETTVENMMVTSDVTKTKVTALIQGARVVSEQAIDGGGYAVTMEMSVFGASNSLATAVLPTNTVPTSFPAPDASVPASTPSSVQVNVQVTPGTTTQQTPATTLPSVMVPSHQGSSAAAAPAGQAIGSYTGLIVDCRGLGLKPVMSPVIKNANGEPIYGYKNLDSATVIANGMASYTTDLSKATRAGSNPLVVKAVGLDNHNGNPILSVADANRVLIENGATGFLDRTNVVFVR
ncbi:LPP20 family lipoprotein [Mitsuokella multacida]|uniref:LPP20 family lipoprotein n=1 Tax=Mitsuokella multacida TaxID=52226 RepID=UPI00242CBE1E|nr:LPP20 family lipoprotein [Mitsuokella multacida]